MITGLRLGNVRSFRLTGEPWHFEIRPLTLFCGTNSAGKSTLLKSVLLLKQMNRGSGGKARFAGESIDLGKYSTFVTHGEADAGLTIGLTISDVMPRQFFEIIQGLEPSKKSAVDFVEYWLDCDVEFGHLSNLAHTDAAKDDEDSDLATQSQQAERPAYIRKIEYRVSAGSDRKTMLTWQVAASQRTDGEVFYQVTFPEALLREEVASWGVPAGYKSPLTRTHGLTFECDLRGLRLESLRLPRKKSKNVSTKSTDSVRRAPIPFVIQDIQTDLMRALARTRYIAPLRAAAKRYYVATFDAVSLEDPTGEQIPFIIRDRAGVKVRNKRIGQVAQDETLRDALDYWLRYLRTGNVDAIRPTGELEVSSREDILVQLSLRRVDGGERHALSDSGFGYSQILPIIAKVLLGGDGTTFLIEQPELHLNPALQVRLAQFFVCLAATNRRFWIETHSEHLVNMMRVLAAEDPSGETSRRLQLYYLGVTASGPQVLKLNIGDDGTVPEWPLEFFGESLQMGARLLMAQKRLLKVERSS